VTYQANGIPKVRRWRKIIGIIVEGEKSSLELKSPELRSLSDPNERDF
jgi:hypothetical protein